MLWCIFGAGFVSPTFRNECARRAFGGYMGVCEISVRSMGGKWGTSSKSFLWP